MRYALVNSSRKEAEKGLNGICPVCGETVVSKCGNIKINHWAHKSKQNCDRWLEKETLWHRQWKNNFPEDWREKILYDNAKNEKHIADICTADNLVIEFQHSFIKPEERISREQFYKNIIWVVDGTRLKNDYKKFLEGLKKSKFVQNICICSNVQKMIPRMWQDSTAPVFFDFSGLDEIGDPKDPKFYMYCLWPCKLNNQSIITLNTKREFIDNVVNNVLLNYLRKLMVEMEKLKAELQNPPIRYINRSPRRYRL